MGLLDYLPASVRPDQLGRYAMVNAAKNHLSSAWWLPGFSDEPTGAATFLSEEQPAKLFALE